MRYNSMKSFISVVFLGMMFMPSLVMAQDYQAQELIDRSRELRDETPVKELKTNDELLEQARRRVEAIDIPDIDISRAGDFYGEDITEQLEFFKKDQPKDVLYVFVSFSMEDSLIKEYIQDIVKTGGIVVIGGLHNDSFAETVRKIEEYVLVKDGEYAGGVMIDPKAFETFAVTKVPTIILAENQLEPCLSSDCLREVPKHDRMMGSVSLSYVLKAFAADGDMKEAAAEKLKYVSETIYSAYEE